MLNDTGECKNRLLLLQVKVVGEESGRCCPVLTRKKPRHKEDARLGCYHLLNQKATSTATGSRTMLLLLQSAPHPHNGCPLTPGYSVMNPSLIQVHLICT